MARIGANLAAEAIRSHGNNTVFSLGGAMHGRLLDVLEQDGVKIIGGRHESAVVAAADGYARVAGRAGVAIVIAEQGVANAYAGLLTAKYACSPLVLIVTRFPGAYDDPRSPEEDAQFEGFRDCVKWARSVPHQERLGEYIDAAFRVAEGGVPGPVLLGIPSDFLDAAVQTVGTEGRTADAARPAASEQVVDAVAERICAAARPLILTGAGAAYGHASEPLTRIADMTGIPVIGRGLGRGVLDETHPQGASWSRAQHVVGDVDLAVVIGARMNMRMHYGLPPEFRSDVEFVQVDVSPENMGAPRNVVQTVTADAGTFSRALADRLAEKGDRARKAPWLADVMAPFEEIYRTTGASPAGRTHPAELARQVTARLGASDITVSDGATVAGFLASVQEVRHAPSWMDHSPLGSMGIGTGLAIGAACAAGDAAAEGSEAQRVLLWTGDGAVGYFLAEFSTMAVNHLPIVVVIGDDSAWGTERHGQLLKLGRVVNTDLGECDYAQVAAGLGCRARRVGAHDELDDALSWAFDDAGRDTPTVLDVMIDQDAGVEMKTNRAYTFNAFHALVHAESGIYPNGAPTIPMA